jgi:hypothetical protein
MSNVPPKVGIFGWRVATNTLLTKMNKSRRNLEWNVTCDVRGNGTEDAHHATVTCTKAAALRHAMRECWKLPDKKRFRYSGKDWLQVLLQQSDQRSREKILSLLWRAWHLRNDVIHANGTDCIHSSMLFLQSYLATACPTSLNKNCTSDKDVVMETVGGIAGTNCKLQTTNWRRPNPGWIKLNSDASFFPSSGQAGAGAVVRDDSGKIMLAACVPLSNCRSPKEAEAKALLYGISLMDNCSNLNLALETDCASLVSKLNSKDIDRSKIWATIDEIKDTLARWC